MTIESPTSQETLREIERKFKVKNLPENLESFPSKSIKQGYLYIGEDGTEIRVRQKGEKFLKTTKGGQGMNRSEEEITITKEEFEKFWPETEGRTLEKTRYEIPLGENVLTELDIYGGNLDGLIVVEVEFPSEEVANNFVPPEWFGEDVTDDRAYKNASLAVNGNPEIIKDKPVFGLESGVEFLTQEIELIMKEKDGPLVVLIAGGSASGKTSAVADKIHKAFGEESIILSLDDYYKGRKFMQEMAEKGIDYNYDQPEVIDLDLFNTHLQAIKNGQTIEKPIYNFATGSAEKTEKVEPRKIIIVEGLFALNEKLLGVGDIKAFVEVGTHGRLVRRILRDIESRGQNPDDILDYFAKVVEPMHEEYIQSTRENAEVVINNEYKPKEEARGIEEMQLKFRVTIDAEKLRKLGAERIGSVTQVDTYCNPKDRNLRDTDEVLRVREEDGHIVVSYKGPQKGGDFRIRPKIDFEINQKTRDAFIKMYGGASTIIKKDRTLYQLNGITFSVDKVVKNENGVETDLGNFIEIRGSGPSDQTKLEKVATTLGLKISDGDKRPYSEM